MKPVRLSRPIRDELIQERKRELPKILDTGIGLILHNAQAILAKEEYFYCRIPGAYISAMFIPESGPIPLGVLIMLWERRKWQRRCAHCSDVVFIIGASYNPLDESCTWWGLCPSCNGRPGCQGPDLQQGSDCDFLLDLYDPARELLRRYCNLPVVPGRSPSRSWMRRGIYGFPLLPVTPVSPGTLIQELKKVS